MSFSIVSQKKWEDALRHFSDANFYQTWAYGTVSWGSSQVRHLVLTDEKGHPAGLAQLRVVSVPVIGGGIAYLRWGPVVTRKGNAWEPGRYREMIRAVVDEYGTRRGYAIRLLPNICSSDMEAAQAVAILGEMGFRREEQVKPYRTIRVNLEEDTTHIRKRFDGKWRNQLNAAERVGLTIEEGTGGAIYQQFVLLYDEMMARKQFDTTVDVKQFERIQESLAPADRMLVMIGRKSGVPVNGLVATAVGEAGIYLLGATSTEGMKSKGAYLLQWQMINRLKERGCKWYDLGGINPDSNPGVYHFKAGMGGEECQHLGNFFRAGSARSRLCILAAETARLAWNRVRRRCAAV